MTKEEIRELKNAIQSQKEDVLSSETVYCKDCGNKTCTCEYKLQKVERARKGVASTAETESRFFNGLGGILLLIFVALILKALNII